MSLEQSIPRFTDDAVARASAQRRGKESELGNPTAFTQKVLGEYMQNTNPLLRAYVQLMAENGQKIFEDDDPTVEAVTLYGAATMYAILLGLEGQGPHFLPKVSATTLRAQFSRTVELFEGVEDEIHAVGEPDDIEASNTMIQEVATRRDIRPFTITELQEENPALAAHIESDLHSPHAQVGALLVYEAIRNQVQADAWKWLWSE